MTRFLDFFVDWELLHYVVDGSWVPSCGLNVELQMIQELELECQFQELLTPCYYGKLHKDQIAFDTRFWETDINITDMTLKSG